MFCFFYNKYNNLKDLRQSLGGYEFSSELILVKCVHLLIKKQIKINYNFII